MDFTPHIERAFKRIAEAVTWTPSGGVGMDILADFRNAYIEAINGVAGTRPVAYVLKSQAAAIASGDVLLIRGLAYRVKNVEQDSTPACFLLPLIGPIVSGGGLILDDGEGLILDDGGPLELDS